MKNKKIKIEHAQKFHYYTAVFLIILAGIGFALHKYYMYFQEPVYIVPAVYVPRRVKEAVPAVATTTPDKSGTIREITMYTSRVEETDASPCISADGTNICEVDYNVCASNAHKIGTRLLVKGLGECVVRDRMNSRFKERIDWYAKYDLDRALKFGKQNLEVVEL